MNLNVPGKAGLRCWGFGIVAFFYLVAVFAPFLAPYDYREQSRRQPSAPPSPIYFRDENGDLTFRPFVYSQKLTDARDLIYEEDSSRAYPIYFFVRGSDYNFLGLINANFHLFGTEKPRLTLGSICWVQTSWDEIDFLDSFTQSGFRYL